jgi:hypothetical protein
MTRLFRIGEQLTSGPRETLKKQGWIANTTEQLIPLSSGKQVHMKVQT